MRFDAAVVILLEFELTLCFSRFGLRFARVISGEEEAIYGWTAVNFVKGTLLKNSEGTGSVLSAKLTYGVLEMGGASTQIGFFEPKGDVMANLFKLQIGAAKHWNVYAHSFLYFGVNGAYARLNARLYTESKNANSTYVYNPCLPGGSKYLFTSRVHQQPDGSLLPLSSPDDLAILEADEYSMVLRNDKAHGDFDQCLEYVRLLLRKEANAWCNFAHDRDCSFAGIYQPPLPINKTDLGGFIATSNFFHVIDYLGFERSGTAVRTSLSEVRDRARHICSFSMDELTDYNEKQMSPISDSDELKEMCFRATFVSSFLIDGTGFPESYEITALTILNGRKVVS